MATLNPAFVTIYFLLGLKVKRQLVFFFSAGLEDPLMKKLLQEEEDEQSKLIVLYYVKVEIQAVKCAMFL